MLELLDVFLLLDVLLDVTFRTVNYVFDWMAHVVQFPWIKLQTMIVLIGSQGCGKGSVINPFLDIFGTNGILLDDTKQLIGNFNTLAKDRVLIFLDELQTQSKTLSLLKSAITNTKRTFEGKYKDAGISEDYSHYIAALCRPTICHSSQRYPKRG